MSVNLAPNQFKIAPGWNASGTLALVTSLQEPLTGQYLLPPRSLGTFDPGVLEPMGDMTLKASGLYQLSWVWGYNEFVYFHKLFRTTYCGSSLASMSGQVTILSPLEVETEYHRMNVWLYLPKVAEWDYDGETGWINRWIVRFTVKEILSDLP